MNLDLLFWLVVAVIFAGWLLCTAAFYKSNQRMHQIGERILFSGLAGQLFYLVAANIEMNLSPFGSIAGLFLFSSLLVLMIYFILDFFYPNSIFEVIFPPLTLFFMMLSMLLAHQEIETSSFLGQTPVFGHLVLIVHAGMTMLGYLLFGVASLTSFYFLLQEHRIKAKTIHLSDAQGPSLGFLDRLNHGVVATGFLFITIGLLVGITMRVINHTTVPELNLRQGLPFLTWAVYAGFLLDRSVQGMSQKSSAIWSIIGFVVVAVSFVYEMSILISK